MPACGGELFLENSLSVELELSAAPDTGCQHVAVNCF
jgi:hypothetical protein